MAHWINKLAVPAAMAALGIGLSGCSYDVDWGDVSGVPLAELDTSGDAPTAIELAGPDSVVIVEGDGFEISVEGDSEATEALRFDRNGDRLAIARDRDVYNGSGGAVVTLTMPAPSQLDIRGSGDIEAATVAADSDIEIAGAGNIRVTTIDSTDLDIEIAGSGTVAGAGTAQNLSIEISGAGDVEMAELTADTVQIEIAGAGNVELASNGTVNAEIAGAGDIVVTGTATCSVSSAGAGSLTCRPPATAATADEATEEEAAAE